MKKVFLSLRIFFVIVFAHPPPIVVELLSFSRSFLPSSPVRSVTPNWPCSGMGLEDQGQAGMRAIPEKQRAHLASREERIVCVLVVLCVYW